jgi:Trehalose-6-phosphate synthase
MGIDYERFANGSGNQDFFSEVKEIYDSNEDVKNILAIDRLDYTKGIPERIKAFDLFLERYPEYIQKVRLTLIVAPPGWKLKNMIS